MVFGNPFYEEIRSAVNKEEHDIRRRQEELAEETDLSEEEIDAVVSETVKRIRSGLYHQEQTSDSLVSLLTSLTWLSTEWNYREFSNLSYDNDSKESLESLFYNAAQMAAQDEADKVEFILENYCR